MAKKQVFGEAALSAKASQRKMAKVVIANKTDRGTYAFNESMIDQESVQEFIRKNKQA